MEPDKLGQLLRQADQLAGAAPPLSSDLAGRVRQFARHRKRVFIRNGALAAGLGLVFGTLMATRHLRPFPYGRGSETASRTGPQTEPSAEQQLLALKAQAERLREELADLTLQLADGQTSARNQAQNGTANTAVAQTDDADSASTLDQQIERAAYLIVYQADRYRRELDMPESAIASYRQTIELFPRTRAAETARVRLAQLENAKGSPL